MQRIRNANRLGSVCLMRYDVYPDGLSWLNFNRLEQPARLFSGFEIEVVIPNSTEDRANRIIGTGISHDPHPTASPLGPS